MIFRFINSFRFATKIETIRKERFLALVKTPLGLQKEITLQEKNRINEEITEKMNELENTGLSREEILLSKSQKGIPLKIDPFFQFLKKNLKAREIYLKKNDRYTVENVIDIALRQDIGPDPSYGRVRQSSVYEEKGRAEQLSQLTESKRSKFNPTSYDGNSQFSISKAFDELKPHQPLRHYFKPIDRYEKKQLNLRTIKKYDIHWRNVQLLRQFMTINGNIKSATANFLSNPDQNKIRKAIKTARQMSALPYLGRTPEPLKRNITSLEDEVKQLGYQHVNLQTGHLYYSRSRSMDSEELSISNENDLDYKYQRMTKEGKSYRLWVEQLDTQSQASIRKSESYARHTKIASQEKKKEMTEKERIKYAIRSVTGLRTIDEESQPRVQPSNTDDCKSQFEKRKKEILEKHQKQPKNVINVILQEKLIAIKK